MSWRHVLFCATVRRSHFGSSDCELMRGHRHWWRCCGTACARTSRSLWEAESLALTLVQRVLGPRTTHAAGASQGRQGRQRLVDRIKLVLTSDLARRWTLAEIAAEVRGS